MPPREDQNNSTAGLQPGFKVRTEPLPGRASDNLARGILATPNRIVNYGEVGSEAEDGLPNTRGQVFATAGELPATRSRTVGPQRKPERAGILDYQIANAATPTLAQFSRMRGRDDARLGMVDQEKCRQQHTRINGFSGPWRHRNQEPVELAARNRLELLNQKPVMTRGGVSAAFCQLNEAAADRSSLQQDLCRR